MGEIELILINLAEIRRRSTILWQGLPEEFYHWRPDAKARTASELIMHVLGADYGWNMIINRTMDLSTYKSPWEGHQFTDLSDELEFAEPYRQEFLNSVGQFSPIDLSAIEVIHPGNGEKRKLGEYLLRIGYHESVHAGQFLSYLRSMGVERPFIWD